MGRSFYLTHLCPLSACMSPEWFSVKAVSSFNPAVDSSLPLLPQCRLTPRWLCRILSSHCLLRLQTLSPRTLWASAWPPPWGSRESGDLLPSGHSTLLRPCLTQLFCVLWWPAFRCQHSAFSFFQLWLYHSFGASSLGLMLGRKSVLNKCFFG